MNSSVNAQIEDMVNAWTRFQGQCWDSLFGIGNGRVVPWENLFSRPLAMSEDMVNYLLQQQSDCLRMVMKNSRPGDGAPKVASEWSEQLESAAQHWIDAQRQAWHTWFAAVRQMDPYRAHGNAKRKAADHADNVFDAWQQATQTTLQAQADWMSSLVSAGAQASEGLAQAARTASNGAEAISQPANSQPAKKTSAGTTAKGAESRRSA